MIARSPASGSWHTTTCSCSWKSCTGREYIHAGAPVPWLARRRSTRSQISARFCRPIGEMSASW